MWMDICGKSGNYIAFNYSAWRHVLDLIEYVDEKYRLGLMLAGWNCNDVYGLGIRTASDCHALADALDAELCGAPEICADDIGQMVQEFIAFLRACEGLEILGGQSVKDHQTCVDRRV